MANVHTNLGSLSANKGDIATACPHWRKSSALYAELGAPQNVEKVEGMLRKANCPAE